MFQLFFFESAGPLKSCTYKWFDWSVYFYFWSSSANVCILNYKKELRALEKIRPKHPLSYLTDFFQFELHHLYGKHQQQTWTIQTRWNSTRPFAGTAADFTPTMEPMASARSATRTSSKRSSSRPRGCPPASRPTPARWRPYPWRSRTNRRWPRCP